MTDAPNMLSAVEAARRIEAGTLTVEELAEACLACIAERDPQVGAFIHIDPEAVRQAARGARADGPLRGLPVAVKDIIDTADLPTEYGSPIYAGNRPAEDAAVVVRTKAAGGLVMGKTVSTEFAWRTPGKTRNPNNLAHTPGGSSSGSAAAVADGMVPLAFGTQTAGSVIRPAAYCGVVGFKPTFGTHDRRGVKLLAEYLDTVGTFARSVEDVAFFDYALRGSPPPRLDVFDGSAPRLAIHVPFADKIDDDAAGALERARIAAQTAGASVVGLVDWTAYDTMDPVHAAVMTAGAARALAWEYDNARDQLSDFYRDTLEAGRKIDDTEYYGLQAQADAFRNDAAARLDGIDAILTVPASGEAPAGIEWTGDPLFNKVWTLLRWPCVTIPAGRGSHGLPVGVQIVTGYGEDARALAVASWLERALAAVE
ncbi:amidase [Thalassobaculum sp.]|uniref:amidase n=1 Tax=Thalassobaculum sp. TaxID=2022740 RepID=UPI0032EFD760